MKREPIVYYDRYAGEMKTEAVFGEAFLRWAYETPVGRLAVSAAIKRAWFSSLYGKWADCPCSVKQVASFIEQFEVDESEFLKPTESFRTFNEFFYRQLKPSARPIAMREHSACFPADGRHLYVADLSSEQSLWAKGQKLQLPELLGDKGLARSLEGGSAVISRLCPTDYHRYHYPISALQHSCTDIEGKLYTVNPIGLARQISYLWQNKRRVNRLTNKHIGDFVFIEIGATNVGSIRQTATAGEVHEKGHEKGYFAFGGSMVMTLFPAGAFQPADDLAEQSAAGHELYAKMGDVMGELIY